jgi:hypothetical protein
MTTTLLGEACTAARSIADNHYEHDSVTSDTTHRSGSDCCGLACIALVLVETKPLREYAPANAERIVTSADNYCSLHVPPPTHPPEA